MSEDQIPTVDPDDAEMIAMMFSAKKKKKKKIVSESESVEIQELKEPEEPEDSYDDLLTRIYEKMGVKQSDSSYVRIKPPKTEQVGSKKTAWLNFRLTCATLNRSEDHVSLFFGSELGVLTSITQEGVMLIRGIFPGPKLESCIRKYMENYVKCPMCRSTKTTLRKDTDSRLMMMDCDTCKACRSVTAIQVGFHATTKSDRKKAARGED